MEMCLVWIINMSRLVDPQKKLRNTYRYWDNFTWLFFRHLHTARHSVSQKWMCVCCGEKKTSTIIPLITYLSLSMTAFVTNRSKTHISWLVLGNVQLLSLFYFLHFIELDSFRKIKIVNFTFGTLIFLPTRLSTREKKKNKESLGRDISSWRISSSNYNSSSRS